MNRQRNELSMKWRIPDQEVDQNGPKVRLCKDCQAHKLNREDDKHTHRQTDASDFIICPMLCYSNGTDNYSKYAFSALMGGRKGIWASGL